MGLYDRDYVREEPKGFFLGGDRSMVVNLVLINVAIFLVDVVFFGPRHQLSQWMEVKADLFEHPWNCWQLLTAGFAHDPTNILHVGLNMFGLWLFGRDIEVIYGKREFLRVYLTMIVVSSLAWLVATNLMGRGGSMLGASGAVNGVMVLYVLHYPRRLFYFWGVFPVPAWVVCTLMIGQDLLGFNRSIQGGREQVAYAAHLGGAVFAFIYYKTGWNFGRWLPSAPSWKSLSWKGLKGRPKLRVHKPAAREQDLGQEVDRILEKISAQGESSLTAAERRTLEEASRRYQQKRR
ncbi:MAG TPA: rhomboid family intramembrane serine protease [Pirellulales bacterium]|nr:rhomboid family intramembrane serine protease [Pirellulales bacterium]